MEENAEKYGNFTALQFRQGKAYRQYSFKEVLEISVKLQFQLTNLGVIKGDRVAIISENRPEWAIAFLAATSMGAIAVPLDAQLHEEEIIPLVKDAEPKVIILSERFKALFQEMGCPAKEVLMEEIPCLPPSVALPHSTVNSDDVASIVYTSGTTGAPKGVMLTHRNIMSNVIATAALFDLGPGDNFLSVLPLHHTFETTAGFLAPFYKGCCITYAESLKSYNLLRNMQETGVTVMCGVPLLYQLLFEGILREIKEKGFSFLLGMARFFRQGIGINIGRWLFTAVHKKFGGKIRFFVTGGAAMDPALIRNFELLGFTLLQGYGLTESAPILSADTLKANRVGAVGKPLPGVEIKIAGENPVGEILAFGPNIMKGYYRRKDLTAEVIDRLGWLHTGDVGYLDEEGFLYITGRCKDVIVTAAGVNVYPEELEFRVNKLPAVKEACIFGVQVKDGLRRGTEEIVAVIVPKKEFSARNVKEQVDDLNGRLADYKRIARIILREEELPKTRLLKVKKFALRKELGL